MKVKRCTKCLRLKRVTSFSYDKRRPEGRQSHCRACMAARVRIYIRMNKEKVRVAKKLYYLRNVGKIKAKVRRYELKNRTRVRRAHQKWVERNRDRANAYSNAWYYKNTDKCRESTSRWERQNPEKVKAKVHRRLAKLKAASGTFTGKQLKKVLGKYGRCCVYCAGPYEAIDHVIPLSRGGTNYPSNLRPCCSSCNSSKGSKLLSEWYGWKAAA